MVVQETLLPVGVSWTCGCMLGAKDRQWESCFAGIASGHPSAHLGMVLPIATLAVCWHQGLYLNTQLCATQL